MLRRLLVRETDALPTESDSINNGSGIAVGAMRVDILEAMDLLCYVCFDCFRHQAILVSSACWRETVLPL